MGSSGETPLGIDDRGAGHATVLLHPFPLRRDAWAGIADALAAHRRVITVDARGFGASPVAGPFAITDIADDLAALLDRLSIAKATVVGMSMGGYAALAFAARHRDRLSALVLADTRAAADSAEARAGRAAALAALTGVGPAAYLAGSLPRLLSPGAPPALVAHVRARSETRAARLRAGIEALRDRPDRSAELGAIACPTLVVCGVEDQVTPAAEMKQIAAAIAGARFVPLEGAGHLSHIEAPGAFLHAVASFLDATAEARARVKLDASFFDRVQGAAHAVSEQLGIDSADVGVVLGSGLGGVADWLEGTRSIPYASLPGFPETTVAGHPGRLVAGTVAGKTALLLCGRVHGYEGYPPCEIGFGVRVVAALGVRTIIVTNAAGGVDPTMAAGDIVAISDHINLTGASPLSGPNDERLGPRFVDMTDAYDPVLRAIANVAAPAAIGRPLREAIYAGMAGPAYETPAEVRLLRTLGAGLVGMSTVHEVIAARHAGVAVLGLSLVANPAAGVTPGPLRHEDVTRAAAAGADAMGKLIVAIVAALPT